MIPADEPEDLPGTIEESRRRKVLGVRNKGKKSPMLELVAKAMEEMMSDKA